MSEVFQMIPASSKPLWFLGAICGLLILLIGLFGYIAHASQHARFEVSRSGLTIIGDFYGRTIPVQSLVADRAMRIDLSGDSVHRPRIRTFGTGLPGYSSGWFRLRNGEKALLYVTDPKRAVYIPTTEGYSLVLSVAQPEAFLRTIARLGSSS